MHRLREANIQIADYPVLGAKPLGEYELVDIFFRMMPFKWRAHFQKAKSSIHLHTTETLCDYFERLETLQGIEKPEKKRQKPVSKHKKPDKEGNKSRQTSTYREKRFCHTCKEAGKPKHVYSSHNTNYCRS